MLVMDGLEATRRIRQLPGGDKVRIVAVTASAFKEYHTELLTAGMDGVIRKPYRFDEIYEHLLRQLRLHFIYAPEKMVASSTPQLPSVPCLKEVASDLREQLRAALEFLDPDRITMAVNAITTVDSRLGQNLSSLIDEYRYSTILQALDSAKESSSSD